MRPPPEWKRHWVAWRNRIIASNGFQKWASALWPIRSVARARAASLFDLVAGFTYSQTLLACVESGLLDLLEEGPVEVSEIEKSAALSRAAALRLLRAAAAIEIAEEVSPGWWMLGQQGAALRANDGARAMILHHRLLYKDLSDPLALLRADRQEQTELSRFWHYASQAGGEEAEAYSRLMATSQAMVSDQVLAAYHFSRHTALLDVGGGHGRFVSAAAAAHPELRLGIFDLPPVLDGTAVRLSEARLQDRITLHSGSFFHDAIPGGYDCISLVRILHDHDDDQALHILRAIREALPEDGRLVIAEPMADTPGARGMGDAYFGLYLWAMNAGRPRSAEEIGSLLKAAGFSRWKKVPTRQPVIASMIVSYD